MIRFLLKGLLRDKNRSLLPIIVVSSGVILTVFMRTWLSGVLGDMVDFSARYSTGHVKVMTRSYAENIDQIPNDLAYIGISDLKDKLRTAYPDMNWTERISFGGLLDAPDENGETRSQGTVIGMAVNLFSENSPEIDRLNILKSIIDGTLPDEPGEILISHDLSEKLEIHPGDEVTLISSTMFGSMAFYNFTISGTVRFGMVAMDKGAIIVDISDAQIALDMNDAAGEILGYFNTGIYDDLEAVEVCKQFNSNYRNEEDEFSPVMRSLREQNELSSMLDYMDYAVGIVIFVFVFAMSLVLWNAGLLGGLRRYGEIGLRLAIGENKGHVYRSMISESVLIGIIGSFIGTIIGLSISYLLQKYGIDTGAYMKNTSLMIPTVLRAKITPDAYYIGFIPGLISTTLGTMLSGIGIYKRKTAQLFKELEV